jgi:hypothetical protein
MSRFRYSRLALSRFFSLLAIVAIPDGEGGPTAKLIEAEMMLKRRSAEARTALKAKQQSGETE